MLTTILLIVLAAVVGVLIRVLRGSQPLSKEESERIKADIPEGCCGRHADCVKLKLRQNQEQETIEYFEDEELDRFAQHGEDAYTEEEQEAFREVFSTLRPEELDAWLRSLQLRGISFPKALQGELNSLKRMR